MEPNIEAFLIQRMAQHLQVGYILVDASLTVLTANDLIGVVCHEKATNLNGRLLTELLPELIGVESALQAIIQGTRPSFSLCQVQRSVTVVEPSYYDLVVEPFSQYGASLLVMLTDVTVQTQQQQRLQQQRNELGMLSAKLATAHEQLAYVIHRFVPTAVAQQIIEQQQLPLLGKTQGCEATIVFADMRNFSEIAEAFAPEQTLDILNRYLTVVIWALQQHGGSIVQIVGDMVMASFNVPAPQPDHASRGTSAAQAVIVALQQFVDEEKPATIPTLGFGLGICSGAVTAGYLGADQRYRYAVVGDATNVAFHLCARAAAGQILAADSTVRLLGDEFVCHSLGTAALKSRRQQISFYEILHK